jgi:hypothetical protein
MPNRKSHADRAELLRRVLNAFPSGTEATSSDLMFRTHVEGAVIAEELSAELPVPPSEKGSNKAIRDPER